MKRLLLLLFCAANLAPLAGQDIHWSQAALAPFQQNPAMAGIFSGDVRAGANYRKQWKAVPVPYETQSLFADAKLADLGSAIIGGGIKIDHDEAGDAAISWTNATLFGSISRILNPTSALSFGIALGGGQRSFDLSKLKWGKQYVSDSYVPTASTGESLDRSTGLVPEIGAGVNYHVQEAKTRTRFDLGLGAFHLTRPTVSFRDEKKSRLASRFNLHAGGAFEAGKLRDFLAEANFQAQGPYKETLLAIGVRRWLAPEQTAVSFILGTRLKDAIIPQVRLEWGAWLLGASYDWNFSPIADATRGKGGPELPFSGGSCGCRR